MSLDYRYQGISQPVAEGSLNPHHEMGWEEVYKGWQSKENQYYWKKLPVRLAAPDGSHPNLKTGSTY